MTYVAAMALDPANTYIIGLRNAVYQATDREPLAKFVTIDNVVNNQYVTINVGAYSFSVPPYMRDDFELPVQLDTLSISVGSAGAVNVYFSEEKLSNQVSNNLLVQSTAVKTLLFPFSTITTATAQVSADSNTSVNFAPTAADIAYTLLAPVTAGNGWLQFVYNFGTKNVLITPPVGTLINGLWTNAAPLTLKPGQAGVIQCDGATNWYFELAPATGIMKTLADLANASGVLTNDGAGNLSWAASSGDIWTSFTSFTLTGASVTLALGATYKDVLFNFTDLAHGSALARQLTVQLSDDGGATYGTARALTQTVNSARTLFGQVHFFNFGSVGTNKLIMPWSNGDGGGNPYTTRAQESAKTGIITHMKFLLDVGASMSGGTGYVIARA